MELPRGLFWIASGSGLGENYIYSLLKMGDDLYRRFLVKTDMNIAYESTTGKVKINEDIEGDFDYCFMSDEAGGLGTLMEEVASKITKRGWVCWMDPMIQESQEWEEAEKRKRKLFSEWDKLDAVCIPNVEVTMGPDRDVVFDRNGVVSSVMTPNSGDGFWREIFRASGYYGLKAKVSRREA